MPGIVVGIDGSAHSGIALEWAMREAALRRVPVTVITAQPVAASGWGGSLVFGADRELAENARKAAQEMVDKAASSPAAPRPADVTVRSVIGLPAAELIKASEDADLLVVGSRGAGGFARLTMGSVSTQVSHHAHCPVVIVPGGPR